MPETRVTSTGDSAEQVLIPLHPEAVDGDGDTLRWAVPAATLGMVGVVSSLPAALQALLDERVLESVSVDPASVHTTLVAGQSWRDHGARVRAALQEGLATPELWQSSGANASADDLLRASVRQVIDGEVGDYIRSHGGRVELIGIHDYDVEVELTGACAHCPASEFTLTNRIESGIRALYPDLGKVTSSHGSDPHLAQRVLGWFPTKVG